MIRTRHESGETVCQERIPSYHTEFYLITILEILMAHFQIVQAAGIGRTARLLRLSSRFVTMRHSVTHVTSRQVDRNDRTKSIALTSIATT